MATSTADDFVHHCCELLTSVGRCQARRMFGGWGLMVQGNMAVGVMDDRLMVRVGPAAYDDALTRPGASVFDFTGRPMKGWVVVDGAVLGRKATLQRWVDAGVSHALSLPKGGTAKKSAGRPRPPRRSG